MKSSNRLAITSLEDLQSGTGKEEGKEWNGCNARMSESGLANICVLDACLCQFENGCCNTAGPADQILKIGSWQFDRCAVPNHVYIPFYTHPVYFHLPISGPKQRRFLPSSSQLAVAAGPGLIVS